MDLTRRKFTQYASASVLTMASVLTPAFAAPSVPTAPAEEPDFNKVEQDVVTKMTEAGYAHFALLNKANATFYLVQNGDLFLKTPAIYGVQGKNGSITPNGIFSLKNVYQGEALPKLYFGYNKDVGVSMLVHGLVPGREQALASNNIQGRQLSNSCVNLSDNILPVVLGFARQRAKKDPQRHAIPFVIIDQHYSAVEFQKWVQGYKPQPYNSNKPTIIINSPNLY